MKDMKTIFGNQLSESVIRKGEKTRDKFKKKYGDDSEAVYHLGLANNLVLDDLGTYNLVMSDTPLNLEGKKPIIIGNIRMGFGHYRISMAMASAARSMGYDPLWLDLNSFPETTMTKIISGQNDLYSLGSRISSKSKLFNKLVWEPMNYEGFRKLSQNVGDQYAATLMTPIFRDLPKDTPYIATHAWPSQAAIWAGMTHVVNAIPDDWQMALHLSEGAIHTIQTHNSYFGYRTLRGMDKNRTLKPMGHEDLYYTGRYIDHELVVNIEADNAKRMARGEKREAQRYLLTVGGAGSQFNIFKDTINYLLPRVEKGEAVLFINVGDHKNVYDKLAAEIPALSKATCFFEDYKGVKNLCDKDDMHGVYCFYDKDIFSAVYMTNLLIRVSDVLVTKPSELAFYPIPKLFIHRVGGHEKWGAIHSAEIGDGTYECETQDEVHAMIDLLLDDRSVLNMMCETINANKQIGLYNGAYEAVKLAVGGKK